ncbi:MAG: glycosyltransferase family 4 protein [Planctomycetes bacterium]|nr:glycosyltransferase family 4 protein [Planctomycetota bacterium]
MRIAMFSWETMHSIAVGGVAAHVSELSEALTRRGHEVHIFTRIGPGQDRYSLVDNCHYHRCPFELDSDFTAEINNMCNSFAWHMGETAARIGQFDVAHAHDWLAVKALVQARNQHNLAGVFTVHSTEFGRCGNQNHDGRSRIIRDMEWEGAYCSDLTIAVSGVVGREFRQLYNPPEDKVTPIYNAVHSNRFTGKIDVAWERAKYDVGCYDPMVLFAGRLVWQKGPDILLEAVPSVLAQNADIKFVFAGDGEMRAGLQARSHQLGVSHAVRFVGYRRGLDLVNLFKATDMVCVPSRNEPFGIIILEAWSAGKPVVVTHNGGPAEFVNHGRDGLKVYDHPDSVSWGIRELFGNFNHARAMGRAGKARVKKEFSWDRIAQQTEDVYVRAVAANSRRLGLSETDFVLPATIDLRKPAMQAA